mgnify:CR=1 FL=1
MKTSDYHALVDTFFNQLVDAVDSAGADIDCEQAGGILTLVLPDRSRIILNKQEPLHQLWVATKFNGHHFEWRGEQWVDNRSGAELNAFLSGAIARQGGGQLLGLMAQAVLLAGKTQQRRQLLDTGVRRQRQHARLGAARTGRWQCH